MSELPFDRVHVSEGGLRRQLTVVEFLGMPLPQRIRWILRRQVEFFSGSEPVDRRLALQGMRLQKVG